MKSKREHPAHITEIVLKPVLTIVTPGERALAERFLKKSAKACFVTASLSTPVRVEPEIVVSENGPALQTVM